MLLPELSSGSFNPATKRVVVRNRSPTIVNLNIHNHRSNDHSSAERIPDTETQKSISPLVMRAQHFNVLK